VKVLHIAPINSEGELPTFLKHQIESLNNNGVKSEIIGFSGKKIRITSPMTSLTSVIHLVKSVHRADADLIHAHWGSLLGFVASIARNSRVPFLLTLRGSDVNRVVTEHVLLFKIRAALTQFATKRADFVVYVSDNLRRREHSTTMKSKVIPDGTPLKIFWPRPKAEARSLLGWDQGSRHVVFHCGNRPHEKNLQLANEVIKLLQLRIDGLKFVVIQSDLNQEELATTYSAADLLLFTSHAEGSPNTVREAIACGCPVVSVNVGDVQHWIKESGTGAVCGYDSAQMSQLAFESLMSNARANSGIAENYSVESTAAELLNIYRLLR
jgi:teichuronic acid biosynthesis glycosyltransferase TuaC